LPEHNTYKPDPHSKIFGDIPAGTTNFIPMTEGIPKTQKALTKGVRYVKKIAILGWMRIFMHDKNLTGWRWRWQKIKGGGICP
jgi:hypothetical protein